MVTYAEDDGWVLLGAKKVSYRGEYDELKVTAVRGSFDKIKIRVRFQSVNFGRVVVVYGNGTTQELPVRKEISPSMSTIAYELRGENRVINEVRFYYRSKPRNNGPQAEVRVLGQR